MTDLYRAMFVTEHGLHHLIRMPLIQLADSPPGERRTSCGAIQHISISDVVRLPPDVHPQFRCWRCWKAEQ